MRLGFLSNVLIEKGMSGTFYTYPASVPGKALLEVNSDDKQEPTIFRDNSIYLMT